MKKKGFTLIELLAVIVVLAIIALIATPLVLKYIGKAREEAAIASAYAYIDAYEKYAANAILNSGEKINKKEKYYLINNSNYKDSSAANKSIFLNNLVKVNKTMPDDGYLITRDKTHYVKQAIFLFGDIEVECKDDRCYIKGRRTFNSENDQFSSMIIWDGWVTLTLYYPENSIERKYRVGESGEVREEDWIDYEGSITIPLEDLNKVYIKYKLADKVVIIPPKGEIYVDIEPTSYTISEGKEITFKINATEGSEVYYKTGSEWIKYEMGTEISHSTYGLIEAKAVMDEKVYRSDGSVSYTRKITAYDSVYINPDKKSFENAGIEITEPVRMNNGKIQPSYYTEIAGPTITVSPTELATSVTVTLTTPTTARKTYIQIGNDSYKEYTGPVTVSRNTWVYAYYITSDEGAESSESSAYINNIYKQSYKSDGTSCNLPNLYFTSDPDQYNRTQDKVMVTLNHNGTKAYYSYDNVNWKEYTETIEFTSNKRIYGKVINECGTQTDYFDVKNIKGSSAQTKRETLEVDIMANPESISGEYVDKVLVTINYDKKANSKYYQVGNDSPQKYEGPFEVEENTTIYAYASSENGYGSDYKIIDNIGSLDTTTGKVTTKGHASPVIIVRPSSEMTNEVTVTIHYDKNAITKAYKIGNGTYKTYNGSFTVDENTTIYAYSKDASTVKTSTYDIDNIKDKLPVYLINKGNYYILKLNYPDSAKNKEYKYGTNGEWKTYKEDGILLVTKDSNINTDGIIKIEDENGEQIEFKGDYVVITTNITEVMSNLFMRWDATAPSTPEIILDPEEATSEVKVTINYGLPTTKNQYKVVTPDGVVGNWTDYKNPLTITQKNTTIYARSINSSEMYSEEAIRVITNIDEESPVIKLAADFDTLAVELKIKVTVIDDVTVDTVMYDSGNRSESYFKTNGKLIANNSIVTIKENGDYTFYAKDSVGNTQIYTIKVENIDNIAPTININESPTDKVGIESTITIDYKDSTTNKYRIGTTGSWIDYTEPFIVTSDTVLSKNAKNEDGSYTICAQAIDSVGNQQEVCKKIYNLDLDKPDTPIIYSNSSYPILTENGVEFNDEATIYFGTRTDVDNYYSLDGENWILYTGKFHASNGTIYAKSVKKDTGLTTSTSTTITMPSDALGTLAYDGDATTFSIVPQNKSYKLLVDSTMQGRKVNITSYASSTGYYRFYNQNDVLLKEIHFTYGDGTHTQQIDIPQSTNYILFNAKNGALKVYEVESINIPSISVTKNYSILTENGVEIGKNKVSISYFSTSVKNLYKTDDGEWLEYTGPIDLEIDKTIYAKGILPNGKDGDVISYQSVLPSDSLGALASDNDDTTASIVPQNTSYKLFVDSTMQGRKVSITSYAGNTGYYKFYNQNSEELSVIHFTYGDGTNTQKVDIPQDTNYMLFQAKYGDLKVYEVKSINIPSVSAAKNYSILTENGVEIGKNKVTITYFSTSVKNLYKIDDGEWLEYNGPVDLEIDKTIYAKGILPNGKDGDVISYQSVLPSDSLGALASDNNDTTASIVPQNTSYKLFVDSTMQGRKVSITSYAGNTGYYKFYNQNSEELSVIHFTYGDGTNTQKVDIPQDTNYMIFQAKHGDLKVYEVKSINIPSISATKNYSILTKNGVESGKNKVTITYFSTSIKNLYKIDDGEWLEYNGPVDLEYSKTIFAKGILPNGKDGDIISYQSILPSDALGSLAYDGDDSTNSSIPLSKCYKLLVDPDMQGRKTKITSYAGITGYYRFYNQNDVELNYIHFTYGSGKHTRQVDIPEETNYILFCAYENQLQVYEISPVIE